MELPRKLATVMPSGVRELKEPEMLPPVMLEGSTGATGRLKISV
jgi:hypothetical protein